MLNIQSVYIKLNKEYNIIEFNPEFATFVNIGKNNLLGMSIFTVANITKCAVLESLQDKIDSIYSSFLVFSNKKISTEQVVTIEYIAITKDIDGGITIKITNWLDWIHALNTSIDSSYRIIAKMNQDAYAPYIKVLSELHWFKALYPLLTHIPSEYIGAIGAWAYFDILKLFTTKRGENKYSKDYNRDTLSRIKNRIKKFIRCRNVDVINVIKDNSIVNLNYNNSLYIPHTTLKHNISVPIPSDELLETFLVSSTMLSSRIL